MGFPVLTVTEGPDGILVRQDRFIETGSPEAKDNETIWYIYIFSTVFLIINALRQDHSAEYPYCEQKRGSCNR
jgi:hypothetical protein